MAYSMNSNWHNFLATQKVVCETNEIQYPQAFDTEKGLFAIKHLAILQISGKDAAQLLQGQSTCDIHKLSENIPNFGTFCTPKGRAITSFIIFKKADDFFLVLPSELLEKVQKRLQLYILRSDVQLHNRTDSLCIFGVSGSQAPPANSIVLINSPYHYLVITNDKIAIQQWQDLSNLGFTPCPSNKWHYFETLAGIPWLTKETSEKFIPQMLNIDKLGGISFDKGCYTGQEIVARTHYLGTAKRQMYLGQVHCSQAPVILQNIIENDADKQAVGKVLSIYPCNENNHYKLLIVLTTSYSESQQLVLDNDLLAPITLFELGYNDD